MATFFSYIKYIKINKWKKIVIIGAGVAGINAATKLVDNGYDGSLITIIDKGNDPINRLPEEVMTGMLGAGGWSDGKLVVSTVQGGQLAKYCGEEKAMSLMEEVVANFTRFHPKPEEFHVLILKQNLTLLNHILTYVCRLCGILVQIIYMRLLKIGINYLLDKGVNFMGNRSSTLFILKIVMFVMEILDVDVEQAHSNLPYDELIFAVGKSGIDFAQSIIK
jgi:uncharacterized FAD-dependent dehydrogenase